MNQPNTETNTVPPAAKQTALKFMDADTAPPIAPKLCYSTIEAATLLSISPKTLYRLRRRGLVKPILATRHLLWPHAELMRFMENTSL